MIFLTHDSGLLKHWQRALNRGKAPIFHSFAAFHDSKTAAQIVWIDSAVKDLPPWTDPAWASVFLQQRHKIIFTSSAPSDDEAITALDAGCTGYCHAFADVATLRNVLQVVESGQVWVGPSLLQRLIKVANHAKSSASTPSIHWQTGLSPREIQVATLAANGASNLQIASMCHISERTIKAHLSSIFQKMNVTDRLQMTLRVHGIS
ncbi:MAG: response regulator transcription factor [Rhodoferax sp.]|nr:MAG: response regulator transcription factor [Rhodoferax sp.]